MRNPPHGSWLYAAFGVSFQAPSLPRAVWNTGVVGRISPVLRLDLIAPVWGSCHSTWSNMNSSVTRLPFQPPFCWSLLASFFSDTLGWCPEPPGCSYSCSLSLFLTFIYQHLILFSYQHVCSLWGHKPKFSGPDLWNLKASDSCLNTFYFYAWQIIDLGLPVPLRISRVRVLSHWGVFTWSVTLFPISFKILSKLNCW